jgi:stage II sporulation protein D
MEMTANQQAVLIRIFKVGDTMTNNTRSFILGRLALAAVALFVTIIGNGCRRPTVLPTPQMDTARSSWVRVRLEGGKSLCSVGVPSGAMTADDKPVIDNRLPRDFAPFNVAIAPGGLTVNGVTIPCKQLMIVPGSPYVFDVNGKRYRGNITFSLDSSGSTFEIVNEVPLEAYLAGVIGSEMPNYWEPEALKAQAIVARTYCVYTKQTYGVNRAWDVSPTQAHQVYGGMAAETSQIWDIVNATKGQVLVCQGKDGQETIFPTYYSSTCGGHTEASVNVFGDTWSAMTGVPCPYCRDIAPADKFQWGPVSYDLAEASRLIFEKYPSLRNLGEISAVVPSRESKYDGGKWSRIGFIKLTGTSGQTGTLKAQDLRLAIDPSGRVIKSTACTITVEGRTLKFSNGHGWGHGVGMCQCGAQGMARKGFKVEQVLTYYYPTSAIRQTY